VRPGSVKRAISTFAILLTGLVAGCYAARPARDAHAVEARIDLETIASRVWILESWREGEPAPTDPQITLRYAAGSLSGRAGCNRYTTPIERRPGLGSIAIGTVAATRMMCPPETMTAESRYLELLPRAKALELRGAKLYVLYAAPNGSDSAMTFHSE
jgi:heat shock protein HslJ